jgi:hypothetical protein
VLNHDAECIEARGHDRVYWTDSNGINEWYSESELNAVLVRELTNAQARVGNYDDAESTDAASIAACGEGPPEKAPESNVLNTLLHWSQSEARDLPVEAAFVLDINGRRVVKWYRAGKRRAQVEPTGCVAAGGVPNDEGGMGPEAAARHVGASATYIDFTSPEGTLRFSAPTRIDNDHDLGKDVGRARGNGENATSDGKPEADQEKEDLCDATTLLGLLGFATFLVIILSGIVVVGSG